MKKIGLLLLVLFSACAVKPSKRMGVDQKYIRDSMMVEMEGSHRKVYVLDSSAMEDLDSLSAASYFGTENGRHVFFQWSKMAVPPNSVTLFALDTSICHLEKIFPVRKEKPKSMTDSSERPLYLHVTFKDKACSEKEDPWIKNQSNINSTN